MAGALTTFGGALIGMIFVDDLPIIFAPIFFFIGFVASLVLTSIFKGHT